MEDKVLKQIEDILEAKDREALLGLYREALHIGNWKAAHDLLLELTIKLLDGSTHIIADMRLQQETTLREIKAIEKRIASLSGGKK